MFIKKIIDYVQLLVEKYMFWALPEGGGGCGKLRQNLRSANCLVVLLHQMRTTSRWQLLLIGAVDEKGGNNGERKRLLWCRSRLGGGWGTAFVENDSFFHCVCSNNFSYILYIHTYTVYIILYDVHCAPTLTSHERNTIIIIWFTVAAIVAVTRETNIIIII